MPSGTNGSREAYGEAVMGVLENSPKRDISQVICGAPSGFRTPDPLIKSQLEYVVLLTHNGRSNHHNACSSSSP